MNKSFTKKFKKLYKGTMFGAALLMCATFMPLNVLPSSAETRDVDAGQPIITLQGAPEKTVKKGAPYTVNAAKFGLGAAGTDYIVGDGGANTTLKVKSSSVKATYKGTTDTEDITKAVSGNVYGTFTPKRIGTYVITYTVIADDDTEYVYDYEFTCETSTAHFEFSSYDQLAIPSVYDLGYVNAKKTATPNVNYDIKLPLPTVYNADDEKQTVVYYANDKVSNEDCVVISVVGGKDGTVEVKGEGTNFSILESDIKAAGEGEYTVTYTYYEGGEYIASTEKNFGVYSDYYKTSKKEAGYKLNTSWATSAPTSAVVGVKTELPAVKGVTAATDNPASEEIPVYYSIQIVRRKNGADVDVTETCLKKEDNKYFFQPNAKGNYRIVYTVKDFYGNTADVALTQFPINDVKDTQLPTVYIYDANGGLVDGEYASAENKLKSTTGDKNVVIYAIGATDNYNELKDMTLKRTIRSAGSANLLEITEYNDYNLIFNYTTAEAFLAANYAVKRDMEKSSIANYEEETVKAWLKEHKYLIATNEEGKTVEEGYAYLSQTIPTFTTQTYRIVYEAKDTENSSAAEKILNMDIKVDGGLDDNAVPTVKAITGLQNAYLPTDKITFTVPTATDTEDSRLEVVSAYRYLNNERKVIANTAEDADVIYAYAKANGLTEDAENALGWFKFDELKDGATQQTIDLNKKLTDAAFVELFVYTIDDAGNVGYFNKTMSISQITADSDAPVLLNIENYNNEQVKHGAEVKLPTLTYSDANAAYMSARVYVYHVTTKDGVVSRELMNSYNMSPFPDTQTGTYVVDAGAFRADYEGDYQVVVIAKDSANNSTATYFDYSAGPFAVYENPVIDNISAETITLELGASRNFPSPTIAMSESETYGYVGLDNDGVTSTYYTVKVNNSASASFDAGLYFFSSLKEGRYTVQYNVYLIRYVKDQLKTEATAQAGEFFLDANGKLKVSDGTKSYFVIVDTKAATAKLIASENEDGTGLYTGALNETVVSLYPMQSPEQTIVVTDTTKPQISTELLSGIRSYYPKAEGGRTVIIPRISAYEISEDGIDTANSYVSVVRTRANGSTSTYTVHMNNWTEDSGNLKYSDGELKLHLEEDGTYTIRYHVVDHAGNYDEISKTVRYGDTEAPKLEIEDGFLNKKADEYKLNDKLILNVGKLTMSDNVTTERNDLLKTISVKVVNVDTDAEIKNNGEVKVDDENPENWVFNFDYDLKTAGEYRVTVSIKDATGWTTERSVTFTVATGRTNATNTYQVVGTVLIVVAVLILVGVVGYFIYSKVKLDKEAKKRK